MNYSQAAQDFQRIEQAIRFLENHSDRQPELEEVARAVHLSEYHFQRLFSRWVGISPKRFLQYLTRERARKLLQSSYSVFDAALESGLSGPSRLHDLLMSCDAVTPGEYRSGGGGMHITYGFQPSPFGDCLIAATPRGVTNLMFLTPEEGQRETTTLLNNYWPQAEITRDDQAVEQWRNRIFRIQPAERAQPLHLLFNGTNFQMKVWEALLRIPAGQVVSYQDIARAIDHPQAVRAVASAVAGNRIAYLVPCHRVIRKMGEINHYRWGSARKKAMLGWEMTAYDL